MAITGRKVLKNTIRVAQHARVCEQLANQKKKKIKRLDEKTEKDISHKRTLLYCVRSKHCCGSFSQPKPSKRSCEDEVKKKMYKCSEEHRLITTKPSTFLMETPPYEGFLFELVNKKKWSCEHDDAGSNSSSRNHHG